MAVTVTPDILEGPESASVGPDGPTATRSFLVAGLEGNADSRLLRALSASGIPRRGDPHPGDPFLPVDQVTATLKENQPKTIQITAFYRLPTGGTDLGVPTLGPAPTVEIAGTVQQVTTNRDVNGNTISITYQTTGANNEPVTKEQGGEVTYFQPLDVVRYSRREPADQGISILDKAKIYRGTVNRTSVFGDPPNTWMCTNITGTSPDNGLTFNVQYEFQRAPQGGTWFATVVYIDPATGRPPNDVTVGNGIVDNIQIYKNTEFRELNLV